MRNVYVVYSSARFISFNKLTSLLMGLILAFSTLVVKAQSQGSQSLHSSSAIIQPPNTLTSTALSFYEEPLFISPEFREIENGFDRKSPVSPITISISVISPKMAQYLFDLFKKDHSIPFDYMLEGCQANAHLMSKIAEAYHIYFGKVYAEGDLLIKANHPSHKYIPWDWHVAPVVYVKSANTYELKVIDPSLFDQPVSVATWAQRMLYPHPKYPTKITSLYYGGRFQYFPNFWKEEWYKDSWDKWDSLDAEQERWLHWSSVKYRAMKKKVLSNLAL